MGSQSTSCMSSTGAFRSSSATALVASFPSSSVAQSHGVVVISVHLPVRACRVADATTHGDRGLLFAGRHVGKPVQTRPRIMLIHLFGLRRGLFHDWRGVEQGEELVTHIFSAAGDEGRYARDPRRPPPLGRHVEEAEAIDVEAVGTNLVEQEGTVATVVAIIDHRLHGVCI